MTSREYIDATNLAKIRAAKAVLRDTLPDENTHSDRYAEIMASLTIWEGELAQRVSTDGN